MRITYCMNIPPLYDLEAEIDCDLDWRFGDEPVVDVNTVTLNGISLLNSSDPLLDMLGGRIALAAEDDPRVMELLLEAETEAA